MKKIQLGWNVEVSGNGRFSVFLDMKSGSIFRYSSVESAEAVHRIYGGHNNYRSRSGSSGAGWIPYSITVRELLTYRVDGAYVEVPDLVSGRDTVPGVMVVAPIDYRARQIREDWPVVVLEGYSPRCGETAHSHYYRLSMIPEFALGNLLCGKKDEFKEIDISLDYIPSVQAEKITRTFRVRVSKGVKLTYKKALTAFFNQELEFQSGEEKEMTNLFWRRLGMRRFGNNLFKIVQRVAHARFTVEELSTVEGLQKAAPENVCVVSPNLYIQEDFAGFTAVALLNLDGKEIAVETQITNPQALTAMKGDSAELLRQLEMSYREKVRHQEMVDASYGSEPARVADFPGQ